MSALVKNDAVSNSSGGNDFERIVCSKSDLLVNAGVCVLVDNKQIALFYLPEKLPCIYALSNWDPIGKASVLSRGVVGDLLGHTVVASPLYKQHFDLSTGKCLEDTETAVDVFSVSIVNDDVVLNI